MATLADINATLLLQTEAIGRQADATTKSNDILDAVRQRISDMLTFQQNDQKERRRSDERARKTSIENKRETLKPPAPKTFMSGFAQGTGFSWLSDFLSGTLGSLFGKGGSLLGLLAGAIGKAAGKLLIWSVLGTAIVNYFGDELKIAADKIDEWFGIDLVTYFKDNPIMAAAATAATGAIAIAMSKLVARIAFRAVGALGAAGLAALGFGAGAAGAGAAGAASKTKWWTKLLGKGGKWGKIATGALALGGAAYSYFSGGRGGAPDVIPPVPRAGAPNPASVVDDLIPPVTQPKVRAPGPTSAQRAALAAIPDSKLPVGFARNAAGKVYNKATGQLAKTSEILDLMKGAGKYAKYAKLLNFLGIAGTVIPALADPAFAIYEGAPEDVIKTQLAGALGSVSGAYLGGLIGGGVGATVGTALPGVGTAVVGFFGALGGSIAGAVAGESLAEELSNFLLGKPVNNYGAPGLKPGEVAPFADIMNDPNRPKLNRSGMSSTITTTAPPTLAPTSITKDVSDAIIDPVTRSLIEQRFLEYGPDRDKQSFRNPILEALQVPTALSSTLSPLPQSQTQSELFDINDPLVKAKAPPPGHVGEQGKWQAVGRDKAKWITLKSAVQLPTAVSPLPSTSGSNLAAANMDAKAAFNIRTGDTYITYPPAQGGGNQTSILTMPITTRDGGDYRDTIRRYGIQ